MSTKHFPTLAVKARQFAVQVRYVLLATGLLNISLLFALAQENHSHTSAPQQEQTPEQKAKASELIRIVRESTERFKDVSVAENERYALQFGCVTGPDSGAMGLHYVN
jgi:hypothetical protein